MGLPLRDHERHTYGEYLAWPEDVRYELIDGQAYVVAPAPGLLHQEIVGEVYCQVAKQLEGRQGQVFIGPLDVCLPRAGEADDDIDTVVQPDVLVIWDSSKLKRPCIRGAPDWVLEVISGSTAGHDQVLKRPVYERAGVREFWLVHPVDRVLTSYRLIGAEYGKPDVQELKGSTDIAVLPGVTVEWDELAERPPRPEYY